MTLDFKKEGDRIYLLGKNVEDLGCSEYVYSYHGIPYSPAPYCELHEEKALQHAMLTLIQEGLVRSAHDISEGGLAITLLESGFIRNLGFAISLPQGERADVFLYGEAGGRIVVSVSPDQASAL